MPEGAQQLPGGSFPPAFSCDQHNKLGLTVLFLEEAEVNSLSNLHQLCCVGWPQYNAQAHLPAVREGVQRDV